MILDESVLAGELVPVIVDLLFEVIMIYSSAVIKVIKLTNYIAE